VAAEWAKPINIPAEAEPIGEATDASGNWQITAYKVLETTAHQDSLWVHPDTEEPIVKEGDPVIYVTFVTTNLGDDAFTQFGFTPTVEATGFDYMGGLGNVFSPDSESGYSSSAVETGQMPSDPDQRAPVKKGESFAQTLVLPTGYTDHTFHGQIYVYPALVSTSDDSQTLEIDDTPLDL
jgi:hypothetical protein